MSELRRDIIAIPTFNRVSHLVACLACLREARGLERYHIFVRDDASTEFGVREIRQLVPQAEMIERNANNLGPDNSQLLLFRDCLQAGARRVLVLDSDMIVSPAIFEFAERMFERSDGFLGLYNSLLHNKRKDIDGELIEKWSVGGTATFWDAKLMRRIVDRCEGDSSGTWDASAVTTLQAMNRRLIVSRRSYAQHVGVFGTNNGIFGHIDYGAGFVVETETQARFMAVTFDNLMTQQRQFLASKPRRSRFGRLQDALKRGYR